MKTKKCLFCSNEFNFTHANSKFCSNNCKVKYRKKLICEKAEGQEGTDFIICHLCGNKVKRIYGQHLKLFHEGVSSLEYKSKFPDAVLTCNADKHNTSANSGKFMKEEKWRKWASDKMKGVLNINHISNTDEQTRKERSPFSKSFYEKKGKSESDRKAFIKDALKDRISDTTLQYYVNKGFNDQDARILLKDRQITFSLDKCIKKYGPELGLEKWKTRQEKWKVKVFNKDRFIGRGTSLLTDTIIKEIIENNIENDLLYGKNEKFIYDNENARVYKYDLTNKINKHIIEINGTFWHCKPELYEESYFHKIKKMSANQIWDYDKQKIKIANFYGYDVLTIWEDDYYKHPKETIEKCLTFIYEKTD